MKIIRVFPRRTAATPDDALAFVGDPPMPAFQPYADEVHVSVTFSWDLSEAERLKRAWERFYPVVKIGGPALGDPGGEFVPGRYLKAGYVVTSRGCPNNCWFCVVPKREGRIRELPITNGWNVLDSNLIACSEPHLEAVCDMLKKQDRRPRFTGGIEPAALTPNLAHKLASVRPDGLFCAYDTPSDLEPLRRAGAYLQEAGLKRKHPLQCYVLCGWLGPSRLPVYP